MNTSERVISSSACFIFVISYIDLFSSLSFPFFFYPFFMLGRTFNFSDIHYTPGQFDDEGTRKEMGPQKDVWTGIDDIFSGQGNNTWGHLLLRDGLSNANGDFVRSRTGCFYTLQSFPFCFLHLLQFRLQRYRDWQSLQGHAAYIVVVWTAILPWPVSFDMKVIRKECRHLNITAMRTETC